MGRACYWYGGAERCQKSSGCGGRRKKTEGQAETEMGDGVMGDGVMEDGMMGDGVMGDGVMGDGVMGDGVMGDGVMGDGVMGDARKLGGEKLEEWCKE